MDPSLNYFCRDGAINERRGVTKNSMCGSCGMAISVLGDMRPSPVGRAAHVTVTTNILDFSS